MRAIPEISACLDESFIGDYLLHGFNQDPVRTVYSDIRRLPPGHVLVFSGRHPELDWQRARSYAADVGAVRMLYLALQLSGNLLGVPVPAVLATDVAQDAPTLKLSLQVARWLPHAGFAPPALRERAAFRMNMRGGGIAGTAYLLRLSLSPTDEDWPEGTEDGRSWLWDALRRPFRLIRKYGPGN